MPKKKKIVYQKKSYRKGYLGEYKARQMLSKMGYDIIWSKEDPTRPDIRVIAKRHENGIDRWKVDEDWEVKYRASVPKCIYDWLNERDADALLVKRVKRGESNPWLLVQRFNEH